MWKNIPTDFYKTQKACLLKRMETATTVKSEHIKHNTTENLNIYFVTGTSGKFFWLNIFFSAFFLVLFLKERYGGWGSCQIQILMHTASFSPFSSYQSRRTVASSGLNFIRLFPQVESSGSVNSWFDWTWVLSESGCVHCCVSLPWVTNEYKTMSRSCYNFILSCWSDSTWQYSDSLSRDRKCRTEVW